MSKEEKRRKKVEYTFIENPDKVIIQIADDGFFIRVFNKGLEYKKIVSSYKELRKTIKVFYGDEDGDSEQDS